MSDPPPHGRRRNPEKPQSAEGPGRSTDVTALGGGRFLVAENGRQRLAYGVAADDGTAWVFLDGATWVVQTAGARRRAGTADHDAPLSAPMPATVLRIEVEPGQKVDRGSTVLVLEAMKMELPLKAPRDGVITAVHCRPGELVQPGVPLIDIE